MTTTSTLQNVIFPHDVSAGTLSLYVELEPTSVRVLSRESFLVEQGGTVSLASYFNAFPAAYWQRWTDVETVTLKVRTEGAGAVTLHRSNAAGVSERIESRSVTFASVTSFDVPLTGFDEGGWLWFELEAADTDLVLLGAGWLTDSEPVTEGKLSIGMTTYNKPDYCVATLNSLASNPELLREIDQVLLIDQGTKKVADETGYDDAAAKLGSQLRIIEQANLGGSGGFSRAMAETLRLDDSEYLILLDDDIELETESVLRALRFARFCKEPTIVGGHMFDLLDRPVMNAWAETVRPGDFMWQASFEEQRRHDFRKQSLRDTPWMHRRLDADYNGWWMCLIPKRIIAEIGLALPVFIKWDDAEYGLRAKAHGFSTVSMPGVALWHVAWQDKDDTQDWQAYFHARNRVIAGLLHSDEPRGGSLLQLNRRQDIKKLLNMQYYAVQLSVDGLRSVLDGPSHLHESLSKAMPHARATAKDFPETRVFPPGDPELPRAAAVAEPSPAGSARPPAPQGANLALFTLRTALSHFMGRSSESTPATPEMEYLRRDAHWWVIPQYRSVTVSSGDGTGNNWYRRDRAKFRRLWGESSRAHNEIRRRWDALAAEYRRELPQLVSPEAWWRTFERS